MASWDPQELRETLRGRVRPGQPMARLTTYGLGGPVDALVEPADLEDLLLCLSYCLEQRVPCRVLGEGSNVLVPDQGLDGVVLRLRAERFGFLDLQGAPQLQDGRRVLHVGAGCSIARLTACARAEGLVDLVFLTGIPGTVGGALVMNAGTAAGSISQLLQSVELITASGREETLSQAECGFSYRCSSFPRGSVLVSAKLVSRVADPGEVGEAIDRYQARRQRTQPSGRTTGCIFKNPAGEHAGRLIEAAGLKGRSAGGAAVSEVHANFIVAGEGATAADVIELIEQVQAEVLRRFGFQLEPEVILLGHEVQAQAQEQEQDGPGEAPALACDKEGEP